MYGTSLTKKLKLNPGLNAAIIDPPENVVCDEALSGG